MGTDIHVALEYLNDDNEWDLHPDFPVEIDKEYWYELILDDMCDEDNTINADAEEEKMKNMTHDEIMKNFGHLLHRMMFITNCSDINSRDYSWFRILAPIRGYMSDIFSDEDIGDPLLVKDRHPIVDGFIRSMEYDAHSHGMVMVDKIILKEKEILRYMNDIIDANRNELISNYKEKCKRKNLEIDQEFVENYKSIFNSLDSVEQIDWFKENIKEPERTRMIYFFDN